MKIEDAGEIIRENFHRELLVNMELNELSGKQLQTLIGGGENSIYLWTNQKHLPRADALLALARTLGTTVDHLLTGKD